MFDYRYRFSGYLLVIMAIAIVCNIYILIPLYTLIANDWNVLVSQTVLGSSVFSFFYAFGLLTFGALSEKFGRKNILTYGMLGSALFTLLVVFSFDLFTLYLFRALQGFILGSFAPVAFSYCFDHFKETKRTLIIALINMGFLVSGVVGPLISGYVSSIWHWQASFSFFALLYSLLFILALIFLLPTERKQTESSQLFTQYKALLSNRNLMFCYLIVFSLLLSFVSFYESLHRFYDAESMTFVKAIGLTGTVASLFVSKLTKYVGMQRSIIIGFVMMILSLILIALSKFPLIVSIFSVVFVASISIIIPSIISFIGYLGAKHRANAISLYSFILLTGTAFGPIISDVLSFQHVLYLLIAWAFLNIIFITSVKQEKMKEAAK